MCGRFTVSCSEDIILKKFKADGPFDFRPRFNLAPSQLAYVIKSFPAAKIETLKWGLIPSWAKDPSIAFKTINARAEGIESKPSFRSAFKKRRCLVIADGFYEWKATGAKTKTPYYIFLKHHEPFAFAGLWEGETFTIITTEANDKIKALHDRMPVILDEKNYSIWTSENSDLENEIKPLLKPMKSENFDYYRVSTFVNKPANDSKECLNEV